MPPKSSSKTSSPVWTCCLGARDNQDWRCTHPKMSVTLQSLLIPQTQVPSAPSSSSCPERTQKASEAESE
jgi:hypothetical protein